MLLKNYFKGFLGLISFSFLLTACGGNSDNGHFELDYLAVQVEKDDNWSIMDGDGKIVVKEEYSPKDEISVITPEGVYWVKSGIDNKYRLYSIDSPKKPLTSEEYTSVTVFIDGKAFVSDGENPIQVIDTKGKVKNTLSREIRNIAVMEKQDVVLFADKNEKCGYLDMDGDIVIEAQYVQAYPFSDGVALVKKTDDEGKLYIIGTNGKEKGKIDLGRYESSQFYPVFKEGKLAVKDKADNDNLVYLDKKGNVSLDFSKDYKERGTNSSFLGGFAIVEDKGGNEGVINDEGEIVIRPGKYDRVYNMGNGTFLVGDRGSKGKYGIVDSEDNFIIEKDYSGGIFTMLDGNYMMGEGSDYLLVTPNGKEIKDSEFQNASYKWYQFVAFHDVQQIATDLVAQIEPGGYTPIKGKQSIKDIANALNLKTENQKKGKRYVELQPLKADVYDAKVSLNFNERTMFEKTHKEMVNDGWFSREKTVSDGWFWNEDAMLEEVYIEMSNINAAINIEKLMEEVGKALEKNGFKVVADGPYYEAKNGDKYAGVSISTGYKRIELHFYPYKENSEDQF